MEDVLTDALSQTQITQSANRLGHENARRLLLKRMWRRNIIEPLKLLTPQVLSTGQDYDWNSREKQWHIWPQGRNNSSQLYETGFKKPDLIYYDPDNDSIIVVKVGVCWFWEQEEDHYTIF